MILSFLVAAVKNLIPPKKEINLVCDVKRKLRVLLPTFKLENFHPGPLKIQSKLDYKRNLTLATVS